MEDNEFDKVILSLIKRNIFNIKFDKPFNRLTDEEKILLKSIKRKNMRR